MQTEKRVSIITKKLMDCISVSKMYYKFNSAPGTSHSEVNPRGAFFLIRKSEGVHV